MNRYTSTNHRPIVAESMIEAAETFALRKARKVFGRSARVATLCSLTWSADGSMGEWSAFIGYSSKKHWFTGCNVMFSVWKD